MNDWTTFQFTQRMLKIRTNTMSNILFPHHTKWINSILLFFFSSLCRFVWFFHGILRTAREISRCEKRSEIHFGKKRQHEKWCHVPYDKNFPLLFLEINCATDSRNPNEFHFMWLNHSLAATNCESNCATTQHNTTIAIPWKCRDGNEKKNLFMDFRSTRARAHTNFQCKKKNAKFSVIQTNKTWK